jgi:outer membrane protein OmpA-like peptidoglycan-associated protein
MNTPSATFRLTLLCAALLASACATTPRVDSEVSRLQVQLRDLRDDQRVAPYAASELRDAEAAVDALADRRRMRDNEFDHKLYLARRLVLIAEAEGLARYATQVGTDLDRERESMLVDARTREADRANRDADRARREAGQDRLDAEQGRRDTEIARDDAARARADADDTRQQLRELQAELADLNAMETARGLVVTVGDVLFEVDRAELRPGARRELDRLAEVLRDRSGLTLAIEGHTDSTGSADYNLSLSERRAASVRAYLVARGIDRDRTTSIGLGQDVPVASNDTASGRQQNRRVEIVIQQPASARVTTIGND